MPNSNLPGPILRDAWCRLRLDAIRAAVAATIQELGELKPGELFGPDDTEPLDSDETATLAALHDCSEELREEAGMALASSNACPRNPKDPTWVQHYESALGRYRQTAGTTLKLSLVGEAAPRTKTT